MIMDKEKEECPSNHFYPVGKTERDKTDVGLYAWKTFLHTLKYTDDTLAF